MPCYSERTNQVMVEQTFNASQLELLKKALQDMGFTVRLNGAQLDFSGYNKETKRYESGSYINGVLKTSETLDVNQVKRSYASQVVESTYGKLGWKVAKKTQLKGVNQ